MIDKSTYDPLFRIVLTKAKNASLLSKKEFAELADFVTDIAPILDYLNGETSVVPKLLESTKPEQITSVKTIRERLATTNTAPVKDFKIIRGDVITVNYENKTRPGLVIRVNSGVAYCLLLSSNVSSPYKLIENNSRFFDFGCITHTMVPIKLDTAEARLIGTYNNSKHISAATRLYKAHLIKLLSRY